ncbi:MAG: carboxypeptidase-like regulatory domain-containing protein [Anaerolineae bacterium]|jgi:hypothetical protein|nr:carboxypeptidase-like regulatory domain-containing protein [Anaerolineae bacterium]
MPKRKLIYAIGGMIGVICSATVLLPLIRWLQCESSMVGPGNTEVRPFYDIQYDTILEGYVTDLQTAQPIRDAHVSITIIETDFLCPTQRHETTYDLITDPNGRFALSESITVGARTTYLLARVGFRLRVRASECAEYQQHQEDITQPYALIADYRPERQLRDFQVALLC